MKRWPSKKEIFRAMGLRYQGHVYQVRGDGNFTEEDVGMLFDALVTRIKVLKAHIKRQDDKIKRQEDKLHEFEDRNKGEKGNDTDGRNDNR